MFLEVEAWLQCILGLVKGIIFLFDFIKGARKEEFSDSMFLD